MIDDSATKKIQAAAVRAQRPDIHAESGSPHAACQGGAGVRFIPQAPIDIFISMAEHQTEFSKYNLCQRCLAAVVKVH